MGSKIAYSVAVLALVILVFSPEGVESECCRPTKGSLCANCEPPPFLCWYCGNGPCNMFGCNCDGGCIDGSCRAKRSVDGETNGHDASGIDTGHDAIRLADTDADGALNLTEVKLFLGGRGVVVEIDAFRALDVDGDGKLTAREIDADVANNGV